MEIPRHWRLKAQRYRLQGSVCPTCGRFAFPPRKVCPRCTAQLVRIATYGLLALPKPNSRVEIDLEKGR